MRQNRPLVPKLFHFKDDWRMLTVKFMFSFVLIVESQRLAEERRGGEEEERRISSLKGQGTGCRVANESDVKSWNPPTKHISHLYNKLQNGNVLRVIRITWYSYGISLSFKFVYCGPEGYGKDNFYKHCTAALRIMDPSVTHYLQPIYWMDRTGP